MASVAVWTSESERHYCPTRFSVTPPCASFLCFFSRHSEDVRCHQVFQVNLQGSFCSVNKTCINRLNWSQTKCMPVRGGRSRGRRFPVRHQTALPFWRCSRTACRPQRCRSRRGSFLGSPGSSSTPDPAGQRTVAECCSA